MTRRGNDWHIPDIVKRASLAIINIVVRRMLDVMFLGFINFALITDALRLCYQALVLPGLDNQTVIF